MAMQGDGIGAAPTVLTFDEDVPHPLSIPAKSLVFVDPALPRLLALVERVARGAWRLGRWLSCVCVIGPCATAHMAQGFAFMACEAGCAAHVVRAACGAVLHLRQPIGPPGTAFKALGAHLAFVLTWGFVRTDFDMGEWIDPRPQAPPPTAAGPQGHDPMPQAGRGGPR